MDRPMLENPKQFLLRLVKKRVRISITNNLEYLGVLESVDEYFNVLLSESIELVKNEEQGYVGDILFRCNNVMSITEVNDNQ
ncbi:hypothetical protein H311_01333 [Anncaliia algerae PRA109]|nr:hypothetical protein H311_01333 [Anncaliia algerae PRA109]